jgi:hypothetical protein
VDPAAGVDRHRGAGDHRRRSQPAFGLTVRPLHVLLLALASGSLVIPSSAQAARGLEIGLTDAVFSDPDGDTRDVWFDRAVDARSDLILLGALWGGIAPDDPLPGFDARNPNDPQYDFSQLDAAVADADGRGFRIAILATGAPDFAEGENQPGSVADGTWKPKPNAIEDFGHALAERYDGTVRHYQLWAEPNLTTYLTPQYESGKHVAALHYRKMISAFFAGVNSVDEQNTVITGGTAPYGDHFVGGNRTPPVAFWRKVLCLRGDKLKPTGCPQPARFDALSHHPINVGKPRRHALNDLDVSTPDMEKLKRVLRKAERTGRVGGPGRHPLWATEIWWDSKPPDPNGVPQAKHARWLAESFYLLWKQGVSRVVWFQIRDQPANGNFPGTPQTGLFEVDGTEKKAYDAFRFPFVAIEREGSKVGVWGKAPAAGQVVIERKRGGDWRTLRTLGVGAKRVFDSTVNLDKGTIRARFGAEESIPWRVN